jgi:ArsR family transcriptional regulator, arsenate/arsenite/antimonite-responsive transcriptional repressor
MAATPSGAVFRAFADQTRRDILKMLRSGPLTSGQIADRFDSSWPTISRHLSVLANADLVVAVRRGAEVYYELNTSVLQDVVQHMMEWVEPTLPRGGTRAARARRITRTQEV